MTYASFSTPSNVRPGLTNGFPSAPRWAVLPPSPSASSNITPSPCPAQKQQKRARRRRRGMNVIPPTPQASSDQELDELECTPPSPPARPTRKRKANASTVPQQATQDEPSDIQDALLKLIGTSKPHITEEQQKFIEMVSRMEIKDALQFVLLLMFNSQNNTSPPVTKLASDVSDIIEKNIHRIVKNRLRSGKRGVLFGKSDHAHVVSQLNEDDERGGLPEDWESNTEQVYAVSRCTDSCTSKIKAEMRRQVKIAKETNKPSEKFVRSIFGVQKEGFRTKQRGFASVLRSEYEEGVSAKTYWKRVDDRLRVYYAMTSHRARTRWLEERMAEDEESYPQAENASKKRKGRSAISEQQQQQQQQQRKKRRSKEPSEEL